MILKAPTSPTKSPDMIRRAEALRIEAAQLLQKRKQIHRGLCNLKHKASIICETAEINTAEWERVMEIVDELFCLGVSANEFIQLEDVQDLFRKVPDGVTLSNGFRHFVHALERNEKRKQTVVRPSKPPPTALVVENVRQLLSGRNALMIGGTVSDPMLTSYQSDLGLNEIHWIGTSGTESYMDFEPYIANQDITLVLLNRFVRTDFKKVAAICKKHGKILVRLPHGYGVNQVALQVYKQASKRL